jgi:hypothetical protein
MTFKTKLYNILSDLDKHNNTDNDLLSKSVQERLLITLKNYNESIDYSKHILSQKNPVMVLRRLNRRMKHD